MDSDWLQNVNMEFGESVPANYYSPSWRVVSHGLFFCEWLFQSFKLKFEKFSQMETQSLEDEDTNDFVDVETPDTNIYSVTAGPSSEELIDEDTKIYSSFIEQADEVDYDAIEEFCFESDELALKGNADYKNLLEAIVVLESQKSKATKDLDTLDKLEFEALSNPHAFIQRLQNKEKIDFPKCQKVYQIPAVDWSKYALDGNPAAFGKRQISLISKKMSAKQHQVTVSKIRSNSASSVPSTGDSVWTAQEEETLKSLLSKFPKESIEAKRWETLALHFNNYNSTEIANKVNQILSLENEMPKKRNGNSIVENDEDMLESEADLSDDEDILPELRKTSEYQELLLMKKVLQDKLRKRNFSQRVVYQCYRCKSEPIAGVRWHCVDCKPPLYVDFCDDCAKCLYETDDHAATHQLERHHINKGFLDRDYMHFLGKDYNYLDPNYMPAT